MNTQRHTLTSLLTYLNVTEREELYQITYKYEYIGSWVVNSSLFVKLGGANKPYSNKSILNAYHLAHSLIFDRISAIEQYLNSTVCNSKVECNALLYYSKILHYTLAWLIFEAQKTWLYTESEIAHLLSPISILEHDREVRHWDKELYWNRIVETSDERVYVLHELKKISDQISTSWKLSSSQKNEFIKLIKCILQSVPNQSSIASFHSTEKSELTQTPFNVVTWECAREDYKKIFELFIACVWITKKVIVDPYVSAMFDGQDELHIPWSDSYAFKSKQRVLSMLVHEIETHFVIQHNHDQLYPIRWANNLMYEEWKAMLFEWLFKGLKFKDLWYTSSLRLLMAWEILNWDQFFRFLELYALINAEDIDPVLLFNRYKRWRSKELPWVSHQSTTYSRWLQAIKQYLENGWEYTDLYVAKVSLDELPFALKQERLKFINRLTPTFLSEYILLQYSTGSVPYEKFCDQIKQKYRFVSSDQIDQARRFNTQPTILSNVDQIICLLRK